MITPQTNPLTDNEKQDNLRLLNELGECRVNKAGAELLLTKVEQVNELLQKLNEERLAQQKKDTELTNRDRDLAIKKAEMFEELYNACRNVKPRRGLWCWIKKIFSAWTARC